MNLLAKGSSLKNITTSLFHSNVFTLHLQRETSMFELELFALFVYCIFVLEFVVKFMPNRLFKTKQDYLNSLMVDVCINNMFTSTYNY